jgi:hypothetical protein
MSSENQIIEVAMTGEAFSPARELLVSGVEEGKVLYFPAFPFALQLEEQRFLDPVFADPKRKNISLDPATGALYGVVGDAATQGAVKALIQRYFDSASSLVEKLFPEYLDNLRAAPTSLRLHRVETRKSSWRKDDSRLHVDAFPSRPNYGERILRIFMNINPANEPRVWRVGEPFGEVAEHFLPRLPRQWPGSAALLAALKVTKKPRSEYDHYMLKLHDAMKADLAYQRACGQQTVPFPSGAGWVCFSDQTSHAVMSGQFMLEQTFFLPVSGMVRPEKAPLAILEKQAGRSLI